MPDRLPISNSVKFKNAGLKSEITYIEEADNKSETNV